MADNDIKVEEIHGVSYYSVETPSGQRWSWDEDDLDVEYIESSLWAWSRLLDYVKAEQDA